MPILFIVSAVINNIISMLLHIDGFKLFYFIFEYQVLL